MSQGRFTRGAALVATLVVGCLAVVGRGGEPAALPLSDEERGAKLTSEQAQAVLQQLQVLRTQLPTDASGTGQAHVATRFEGAQGHNKWNQSADVMATFSFSGPTSIARFTNTDPTQGLNSVCLRSGGHQTVLSRRFQPVPKRFRYSVSQAPINDRERYQFLGELRDTWSYAAMARIPDLISQKGDPEKQWFDLARTKAELYRNGNEVVVALSHKTALAGAENTRWRFDLAKGGVWDRYEVISGATRCVRSMEWRMDEGQPVPVHYKSQLVENSPMSGSKLWDVQESDVEFRSFKLAPVDPHDLTLRAMKIPPATNASVYVPSDPRHPLTFPYSEANWKRLTGQDPTEPAPTEEAP